MPMIWGVCKHPISTANQTAEPFREKAAKLKSLEWAVIDASLYNILFTGRAKLVTKCAACLSDKHTTDRCPASAGPSPAHGPYQSASTQQHPSLWRPGSPSPQQKPATLSGATTSTAAAIGLYNSFAGPRCAFMPCRCLHICSSCRGDHPRSRCPSHTEQHPPQAKCPRLAYMKGGQ